VDFALAGNGELTHLLEIKLSDGSLSRGLAYFKERHKNAAAVQLVHNLRQPSENAGVSITRAADWLAGLAA